MKPKVIRNEEEYAAARASVETLLDAAPSPAKEEQLGLWSARVERYVQEHFPMENTA